MKYQSHYEAHTAESYESAFFYEEGAYTKYLCDLVGQHLGLKEQSEFRTLLDIGGGTGNFTRLLLEESPGLRAVVVDPFLSKSSETDGIRFVKAPAEAFTKEDLEESWRRGYSQILMKEVVHHFQESDRIDIFRGILRGAQPISSSSNDRPIPTLLILTRPQAEIDYPLWKEARDVWAKNQPHVHELIKDLTTAGFGTVDYKLETYPCSIPLKRWQNMVKQRFWSTFANFSDSELEDACTIIGKEWTNRMDSNGLVHFEDRLLFIRAYL